MTDTIHRPEPPTPPAQQPRGELASSPMRLALIAAATIAFGVWAGVGWIIVILALMVMIFLHELGHFLTAKWSGMKATEFFLGFGPKLWSFQRGETEYGFKAIPAGAYVRIIGMNNLDEVAPDDEPRTYRQQSFPKRILVASAGSGMHFLQAFVLFAFVFGVLGAPASNVFADRIGEGIDESDWIVGEVVEGSAAEQAGLEVGDDIVSIDGEPVTEFSDIGPLVTGRAGDEVAIVIERDGSERTITTTIGQNENDPDAGFLGVGGAYPDAPDVQVGPVAAVGHAAEQTVAGIGLSIQGMTQFFTGGLDDFADQVMNAGDEEEPSAGSGSGGTSSKITEDENRVVSIYGVGRLLEDMTSDDFANFLLFLAMINLFIGVFNLIPLLPLDGGHVAVAIYERIRSRPGKPYMADVAKLLPVAYAAVMFLTLLGVSSLYLDIVDPIG